MPYDPEAVSKFGQMLRSTFPKDTSASEKRARRSAPAVSPSSFAHLRSCAPEAVSALQRNAQRASGSAEGDSPVRTLTPEMKAASAILAAGARARGEAPPKLMHGHVADRRIRHTVRDPKAEAARILTAGRKAAGGPVDDITDAGDDDPTRRAKDAAQRILDAAKKAGNL